MWVTYLGRLRQLRLTLAGELQILIFSSLMVQIVQAKTYGCLITVDHSGFHLEEVLE